MPETNYNQIVWLASYPKSGNTWLRTFLDAYVLGEVDINNLISNVSDSSAARALPGMYDLDPSKFPVDIQMLTRPMALLRMVLQYNANKLPGLPLMVKTHNLNAAANGFELLPVQLTKATINIVRDPRDVVISYAKHMGCEDIDEAIGHFLNKYRTLHDTRNSRLADFTGSWPMHVRSFLDPSPLNVLTVKYEDMKDDPINAFGMMLRHAGMEVDKARIQKALDIVKLDRLKKQEEEKGFLESSPYAKNQFFGSGKTGGWKDVLNPSQLRRIEKACAPMMKRLGYDRATNVKVAA